jgi:hypothetical protein
MHSGGHQNTQWAQIFIEAPEDEARRIFVEKTGQYPDMANCDCCGANYSITEAENLAQATAYERNCKFDNATNRWVEEQDNLATWRSTQKHISVEEYAKRGDVLILRAPDFAMPPIGTADTKEIK